MNRSTLQLILVLIVLALFIAGFVINITSDSSLYNQNMNIVPQWQRQSAIDNEAFYLFMNLVSQLLDPPVCAAYLAAIWLFTSRRLEVMVFLLWFIFMSWLLSAMKSCIQQPRPFWQPDSMIMMKSWICYTEYGCPSGHSWMGLVLLQYLLRFLARGYTVKRHIWIGYVVVFVMQCALMFSRVILGMHTFNEVLIGAMLGIFTITMYYTYIESFMVKLVATFINNPNHGFQYFTQMPDKQRKRILLFIIFWFVVIVCAIDLVVTFIPSRNNQIYWNVIENTSGCDSVKEVRSFQWRCLEDMAIMMAGVGMAVGLIVMENPGSLVRPLNYSRCSGQHRLRLLIWVLLAAIPLVAFLNPLWYKIDVQIKWLALILWICQSLGFFLALFLLVCVAPKISRKFGFQHFKQVEYILPLESDQNPSKECNIQMQDSGDDQRPF